MVCPHSIVDFLLPKILSYSLCFYLDSVPCFWSDPFHGEYDLVRVLRDVPGWHGVKRRLLIDLVADLQHRFLITKGRPPKKKSKIQDFVPFSIDPSPPTIKMYIFNFFIPPHQNRDISEKKIS